jgi:competence/damage-inducible protein CinA-like protein
MPSAEIIAIGTELLLGEIQDTNTRELAKYLRNSGIDLFRATLIGDNPERIATVIREALTRSDIIITTGGLGPTVDDPTRDAVALAVGVTNVFIPELWDQIISRFQRYGRAPTENNRKQAYVPEGSITVENEVGTAPSFIYEIDHKCVISLPGVPREMEFLMNNKIIPYLRTKYELHGIIKACVLHTAGVGESQVDEWVSEFEKLSNPTVGLLAHPGQTDVRITVKANSEAEADRMINDLVEKLRPLLGESLYGIDNITIEDVIREKIALRGWNISGIESNLGGKVIKRLENANIHFDKTIILEGELTNKELENEVEKLKSISPSKILFGVSHVPGVHKTYMNLIVSTPGGTNNFIRSWGGPPQNAHLWAIITTMDYLRRII